MSRRLTALRASGEGGAIVLRAPAVGLWREAPALGARIDAGAAIGSLEVLGERLELVAPPGVRGLVGEVAAAGLARRPVQYGDPLVTLSTELAVEGADAVAEAAASAGLVFAAPSSGRFYLRPAPDKDAFVVAGQEITTGDTVCLLEVMKTFNRIAYGGDAVPGRARVVRVVPADGDDLAAGDPILELEAP